MDKKVVMPHDAYFKSSMRQIRVAKKFFQEFLPQNVLAITDLSSLSLEDSSFVNEAAKELRSDVLFSVKLNGKKGYFYLLVEHQSSPDKLMPFRLMQYVMRVIESHLKNSKTKRLPLVVPMVFYHGKRVYPYTTDFFKLFSDQELLAREILFKPFRLIDTNLISDEELKQYGWLSIMGTLMKHVRSSDIIFQLEKLGPVFDKVLSEGGEEYVRSSFYYIFNVRDLRKERQLLKFLKGAESGTFSKSGSKVMTSLADYLRNEGMQQGLERGIQQGMQQGMQEGVQRGEQQGRQAMASQVARRLLRQGFRPEMVSEITELDLNTIRNIAQALELAN